MHDLPHEEVASLTKKLLEEGVLSKNFCFPACLRKNIQLCIKMKLARAHNLPSVKQAIEERDVELDRSKSALLAMCRVAEDYDG